MKSLILTTVLSMSLFSTSAQSSSDYDISTDAETGATVYKGQCTFEDLEKESSFSWFDKGVAEYKPDTNAVAYLRKHLPEYNLVILLGTWCEDSHNLIPKLYKTLQLAGYPTASIKMYAVDRAKEAKYVEHRAYKLEKVPTIIIYKGPGEKGRIVENVKKSIEEDLAEIIKANTDDAPGLK